MGAREVDRDALAHGGGEQRRSWRIATNLVVFASFVGASACGSADESSADEPGPAEVTSVTVVEGDAVVRGFLVLGTEVRSIKPCGEERELWVVPVADLTTAYEELSREPYAPVFVEVEGRLGAAPATGSGADYDGLLTVRSLRRAAPAAESVRCDEDVSGFSFRASGAEPFWHIQITPSAMVYSTPDLPETRFSGAEPFIAEGGWVYESEATGPESLLIRATLAPGRCRDTMAGAIYSWSATVELAGEVRRGCAWMGDLAPGR